MSLRFTIAAALCISLMQAAAIDVSNRYRSPRNPERQVRASTELIVLHTTEAPARSSLNKLSDRGECHYVVTEDGSVYAIVDRDREAFHAGRSMWNGREDVDKYSVGIECVGYHDKPMGIVQIRAIAALVKDLKAMYRISDDRVVCHSHVAYGAPNKWQKRRHRGRKRCGMLFAMASVRKALGLQSRPAFDSDTRAGRLTVGDEYLQKVLYGNVDTMRTHYGANAQLAAEGNPAPAGGNWVRRLFGKTSAPEPAPKVSAKPAPKSAPKSAPKPEPKPEPKPKLAPPTSIAQLKARGYVLKGTITKNTTAMKLVGSRWNDADTYYSIRNHVYSGKTVDPKRFEKGMGVWIKP